MEPPGTVGVDGWFSAIIFCRTSRILSWRHDFVGKTLGCLAINCAVACAVDTQAIDLQPQLSWHMSVLVRVLEVFVYVRLMRHVVATQLT